ncbi:MAG: glycosyltransferase [Ginsengibacter sp.]
MIYGKKINKATNNFTVIIAPLDWGLGHVTRCIPIISLLQHHGCEVLVAANEEQSNLLKKEFPSLVILRLFGYKIRYSRPNTSLRAKLLFQTPKLYLAIVKEQRWLKKIVNQYRPDLIISDNRFGFYHKHVRSIYITHQLSIKTGNTFLDKIASKFHRNIIEKFHRCWVPDFLENGLAGELSHPKKSISNTCYIGALSRFENLTDQPIIYDVLISISGPEPQRSIFEETILLQVEDLKKRVLIVRGLPMDNTPITSQNSLVTIANHLPAKALNEAFLQSSIVICRSGYTTIMDLVKIKKRAILVPTPGQTEQEYLAEYLMFRKNFLFIGQKNFSIESALIKASQFEFKRREDDMDLYKKIIPEFIESLAH